ncbi:hypothetical protein [Flavobacterium sp.]|uniref:hypothetical protein n=1 Tax=Flavobacterium sp. TaxID=239 RepID=UPI002629E0CA|nr:hypothetical protein [Flavobacterium sp.]
MTINNLNHIISSNDFDILHQEKTYLNDVIEKSTEVIFEFNGTSIRLKFDLTGHSHIEESNFLFIPETSILFYSGSIEWCAFDLINKCLVRHENATQLPYIERRNDIILIFDDMYVECTDLKAEQIDNVPVDPPTESVVFEDRIEFNSSIFGKQILKLQK